MPKRRIDHAHIDRMLGDPTTQPEPAVPQKPKVDRQGPGRPRTTDDEQRHKVIAKVPPELWRWAKRRVQDRQLAGDRVDLGDGRSRAWDMGDLVADALELLRAQD